MCTCRACARGRAVGKCAQMCVGTEATRIRCSAPQPCPLCWPPCLQHLNMIQYIKGQHVICAAPHVIEEHLRKCGSAGLEVDPTKIVWCPVRGGGDTGGPGGSWPESRRLAGGLVWHTPRSGGGTPPCRLAC